MSIDESILPYYKKGGVRGAIIVREPTRRDGNSHLAPGAASHGTVFHGACFCGTASTKHDILWGKLLKT